MTTKGLYQGGIYSGSGKNSAGQGPRWGLSGRVLVFGHQCLELTILVTDTPVRILELRILELTILVTDTGIRILELQILELTILVTDTGVRILELLRGTILKS
jgi:hypothetical protein